MSLDVKKNTSIIEVSNDVLEQMVGVCASECFGIVGIASKNTITGFIELLKRENLRKGVKVLNEDGILTIDLYVIVEFGIKMEVVADNLVDTVKYKIEKETNLKIKKINVHVVSVRT